MLLVYSSSPLPRHSGGGGGGGGGGGIDSVSQHTAAQGRAEAGRTLSPLIIVLVLVMLSIKSQSSILPDAKRLSSIIASPSTPLLVDKSNTDHKHDADHSDVVLSTAPLMLLNRHVGSISRLCPTSDDTTTTTTTAATRNKSRPATSACWLMPKELWLNSDNNGPMPVRIRPWMHPLLLYSGSSSSSSSTTEQEQQMKNEYIMYYSGHTNGAETENIRVLGTPSIQNGPWRPIRRLSKNATKDTATEPLPALIQITMTKPGAVCDSLHSPSIVVNDEEQSMVMYIHGHQCQGVKKGLQPTAVLHSKDGITWTTSGGQQPVSTAGEVQSKQQQSSSSSPYLFHDLFYLSPPTVPQQLQNNDDKKNNSDDKKKSYHYYYAVAKTQESPVGSAILCRATSIEGPFERGPVLARGIRHAHVEWIHNRYIFVFFTLIGDAPERILLGTIDTQSKGGRRRSSSSSSPVLESSVNDWMEWKLLPGPTILEPRYEYEHGRTMYGTIPYPTAFPEELKVPSTFGGAKEPRVELRDPRFVRDDDNHHHQHGQDHQKTTTMLSGFLFYTVQGEQAIAVAHLSINITEYLDIVRFRDQSNVEELIWNATSLTKHFLHDTSIANGTATHHSSSPSIRRTTLITGTGRSGTTYVCKLFNRTGFAISHDNDDDCGIYPGDDGAASWYDAFDMNLGRYYDTALHLVRSPLHVINSRAFRMIKYKHIFFLSWAVAPWEDSSELSRGRRISFKNAFRFSLKHWVRRNSFVQRYAEWRESIEDISSDSMVAWRLCMASYLGAKCPSLFKWNDAVREMDHTTNTDGNSPLKTKSTTTTIATNATNKTAVPSAATRKQYRWTWDDLSKLGREESDYVLIAKQMAYEYGYDENGTKVIDVENLVNPGVNYDCSFGHGPIYTNWNCWLR